MAFEELPSPEESSLPGDSEAYDRRVVECYRTCISAILLGDLAALVESRSAIYEDDTYFGSQVLKQTGKLEETLLESDRQTVDSDIVAISLGSVIRSWVYSGLEMTRDDCQLIRFATAFIGQNSKWLKHQIEPTPARLRALEPDDDQEYYGLRDRGLDSMRRLGLTRFSKLKRLID